MKTVLSTKTLDSHVLACAQSLNLQVECVDFIETTSVPFNIESIKPENFDAVAFTSANAVTSFFAKDGVADLLIGKQVFALQGKTADELSSNGIEPGIASKSAAELADKIIEAKAAKKVLHVCGNLKLPALKNKLTCAGIGYAELVVYETITRSDRKINSPFDAILFYSPSGVESFLTENNFEDKTVCCCIGSTTAQALKEKKKNANIILPVEPSPLSMISAVADYVKGN